MVKFLENVKRSVKPKYGKLLLRRENRIKNINNCIWHQKNSWKKKTIDNLDYIKR